MYRQLEAQIKELKCYKTQVMEEIRVELRQIYAELQQSFRREELRGCMQGE